MHRISVDPCRISIDADYVYVDPGRISVDPGRVAELEGVFCEQRVPQPRDIHRISVDPMSHLSILVV